MAQVQPLVKEILHAAEERNLLLLSCGTYGNVIRFLPPLSIGDATAEYPVFPARKRKRAVVRVSHAVITPRKVNGIHVPPSAEVVVNHVAAFHAHQRGDFFLGMGAADIGRSGGQHQVIREFVRVLTDGINQAQGTLDGFGAGDGGGNIDGKENRIHAAFAHARDINVAAGVALAKVEAVFTAEH